MKMIRKGDRGIETVKGIRNGAGEKERLYNKLFLKDATLGEEEAIVAQITYKDNSMMQVRCTARLDGKDFNVEKSVVFITPEGEEIYGEFTELPPFSSKQPRNNEPPKAGCRFCDELASKRNEMIDIWKDKIVFRYLSKSGIEGKEIKNIMAL